MRGHIRKRGGSWAVVLSLGRDPVTGKRRQRWVAVPGSRQNAERRLAELLQEYHTGGLIEPSKMTLAEFLRRWMDQYARVNVGESTLQRWDRIIETHLIPALGAIPIAKLRPAHIVGYYAEAVQTGNKKTGGPLSRTTLAMHHQVLRQAMGHALKWELVPRNVVDVVDRPRGPKYEGTVLAEDGIIRLLESLEGNRYHMPVYLLIFSGLRRSEVLGLRWSDFDQDRAVLSVRRKLVQRRGGFHYEEVKGRRGHAVALSRGPIKELVAHRDRQRLATRGAEDYGLEWSDSWPICAAEDGTPIPPNTLTNRFPKLLRKAGLDGARLHDLRHSHHSMLLAEGVPLSVVKERANHASIQTTVDIYGHMIAGAQHDAADRFERRLDDARRQSR